MRLRASPKSRQPETKGVEYCVLSMYLDSSAGVRTSLSSIKSTLSASRTYLMTAPSFDSRYLRLQKVSDAGFGHNRDAHCRLDFLNLPWIYHAGYASFK
jgi:hypothetical protein